MAMIRDLKLPLTREDVLDLKLGEMVSVSGEITVSIGLPTHKRLAESAVAGMQLPVDLNGKAFFHLSTYVDDTTDGPVPVGRRTVNENAPRAFACTCTPFTAGSMSALVGTPYCGLIVSSAFGAAPVPL